MFLKLKSIIYKYTGIYLAHKEENVYLHSEEFWKKIKKISGNKKNDISPRNTQGLLIGLWQSNHGFTRCINKYSFRFKKPTIIWAPIIWLIVLLETIKWDFIMLYRTLKNKISNKTNGNNKKSSR